MDVGGATLRTTEGVISFMGDGYENDALVRLRCLCPALSESRRPGADACVGGGAQCEWTIECGAGYSHISLLFSRVETEEDIDVVVRTHLDSLPASHAATSNIRSGLTSWLVRGSLCLTDRQRIPTS